MLTTKAAEAVGRKVADKIRAPRTRRVKFAKAIVTLVKKAGLSKRASAGVAAAIPWGQVLKKLAPYLGAGALGVGSYMLGKKQAPAAGATGGGGLFGGGKQPLWGQGGKRMFGRMGVDPQEEAGRMRAMRDVGAGGQWRAQAHKERQNLIRGMFTQ